MRGQKKSEGEKTRTAVFFFFSGLFIRGSDIKLEEVLTEFITEEH